jgi:hypothetical protein
MSQMRKTVKNYSMAVIIFLVIAFIVVTLTMDKPDTPEATIPIVPASNTTIEIAGITVEPANNNGCPATIHFTVQGGTVTGIFWVSNDYVSDPFDEIGNVSFEVGSHTYIVNLGGIGMSHRVRFVGDNASSAWVEVRCN